MGSRHFKVEFFFLLGGCCERNVLEHEYLNRLACHFEDLKWSKAIKHPNFGEFVVRLVVEQICPFRYCCTVKGGREDSEFDVVQLLGFTLWTQYWGDFLRLMKGTQGWKASRNMMSKIVRSDLSLCRLLSEPRRTQTTVQQPFWLLPAQKFKNRPWM